MERWKVEVEKKRRKEKTAFMVDGMCHAMRRSRIVRQIHPVIVRL